VKRLGRDEPMWVAIHKCMEAMLGISLYPKLAKMLRLSYYCLSSLQQNWRRGQNRFCLEARGRWEGEGGREEVGSGGRNGPNNVCTYE
jgi:hypothetical protein